MGGAVALLYAKGDPAVRAVVTLAAVARPGRLADEMEVLKRKLEQWKEEGHHFGAEGDVGETFFEDARIQDIPGAVKACPAPVLILHGALDEVVPVDEARLLYENAPEPRDLVIFPGADHRFVRDQDLQEAIRATKNWFEKYLKA